MQTFPTRLRIGTTILEAELGFEEHQLYEPDPEDELMPFGAFDTFLSRLESGFESLVLIFGGRQRTFTSLESLLRVLGERGIELVSIAFDQEFYRDNNEYWTVSRNWGYAPDELAQTAELTTLRW